ncbi:Ankyrin repeat and KH domain-containing protein mask [Trichoplax sp. H2]|nr:Ankyrin repeat and KH domain-containing protein mask [Trichoplax sp. H2]|eukprot:RDD44930.1 Ankyrin repeat and KH domain-containing protein mask [Trichoplax sp. H2]
MPMPIKLKKPKASTDLEEKINNKVESIYQAAKSHNLPRLKKYENDVNIKSYNYKEINGHEIDGGTPLHFACADGDVDAIQLLLCHGANPYLLQYENGGLAPIHFAAQDNHLECIKTLYRHHPNTINISSYLKEQVLHIATKNGYSDMTKWLIDHGADINHQDHNGNTPLHNAVRNAHVHCVRLLLANGADPTMQNHLSESAINIANHANNTEICELLVNKNHHDDKNKNEENGNKPRCPSILRPHIKDLQNVALKDSIEGDIVQKNFAWMCEIINTPRLTDLLYTKTILNDDNVHKINQQSKSEQKAATLLNILMLCDVQTFYTLVETLKLVDSVHQKLAHILTKEVYEKRKQTQVKPAACIIS